MHPLPLSSKLTEVDVVSLESCWQAVLPATSTNVFGKGQQGAGKGKGGARDPAKMATEMIKTYDKDGDGALNDKELTAALTAIAHRHGKGGGKGKVSQ